MNNMFVTVAPLFVTSILDFGNDCKVGILTRTLIPFTAKTSLCKEKKIKQSTLRNHQRHFIEISENSLII